MSEKIGIRMAGKSDAALIADLSRQTFYDSFAGWNSKENMDKFMNLDFSRDSLMAELGQGSNIFLIASAEQGPLGYAKLRENDPPTALTGFRAIEIARIYAVKEAIGKGIGKLLMEACVDIAKAKDKQVIWLGVWEHNDRAVSFYSKWGFERFGEHIFMLGDDPQTDWLLKKTL